MNADNGSFILKMNLLYEISGSDIGANDFRVLECETKYIGVQMSAFRRNVLPPSSWVSKNVGGKKSVFCTAEKMEAVLLSETLEPVASYPRKRELDN